jgi:hypothetical protein
MSRGSLGGLVMGRATNRSNGIVLCWCQDENGLNIYELGPNRESPSDDDVDAVKADAPATLHGTHGWYKFGDHNNATITGKNPKLELDFTFGSPTQSDSISDDDMLSKGNVTGLIESYRVRGSAIWWGKRL